MILVSENENCHCDAQQKLRQSHEERLKRKALRRPRKRDT